MGSTVRRWSTNWRLLTAAINVAAVVARCMGCSQVGNRLPEVRKIVDSLATCGTGSEDWNVRRMSDLRVRQIGRTIACIGNGSPVRIEIYTYRGGPLMRDVRRSWAAVQKTKDHSDDVSIGNDEWIRFVDIAGRTDNADILDRLIRSMESFRRSLKVHRVSECCGINAHGFWPQDIWNAVRNCHDSALKTKLTSLRSSAADLSADCVYSQILNQNFDRFVFCRLLDHVIATVIRM